MRLNPVTVTRLLCGAAAAAALTFATAAPASAGGYYDHVYADSFGNLIIRSPAGYKRIVVGQGHLADELAEYTRAGSRGVVYAEDGRAYGPPCRAPGVLLHGRSYMYGLDENVVPVLRHPCR